MASPRSRFLSELLGLVFTRLILVGATLVTMWVFWRGLYVPALGLAAALAYFFYLYWQYVNVGDVPEP